MTLPPALTWLHLLPRSARCDCDGLAAPLRQHVDSFCAGGGSPVLIREGAHCTDELLRAQGIVAINARRFSTARLAAAGFSYIRRFAVLPDLSRPRWFVPLDSAAVSSAALCLHTPTRFSAGLKHWVGRAAIRLHLPLWYRDSIWIALRSVPPLDEALRDTFDGQEVRVALSAGAPEPARNRKVSLAVLATDGRILGFGKLGASPLTRRLVRREAAVLASLPPAAASVAPELLSAGEVDGLDLIVQSALAGRPTPPRLTATHRRFLAQLRQPVSVIASDTGLVRTMAERIESQPHDETAAAALEEVMPLLRGLSVPATAVHGDFAPWNLRLCGGEIRAFDWEYGEPSGLPLIDELHFGLQVGYQLGHWAPADALNWLRRVDGDDVQFGPHQVRAMGLVYLLDQIGRLASEGYARDDDMFTWYSSVLSSLVARQKVVV